MASKKTFYVTTAIDYPNAEPHIGHAYQKVIADILARRHKLLGDEVFFLTGTDEHGKKIQEAAKGQNKSPKEFVDEMVEKFKKAWATLNIKYDRFIRTTDKDHVTLVQNIIRKFRKSGDLYKGTYEGLYCTSCEAYYTEKDLQEGKCPFHNQPTKLLKEESYFFKLSKYRSYLLKLYEKKGFILPSERKNEIVNRVKEGLTDLSISRTSFNWGIPFPEDDKHIVYVWADALFNYVSGAGKNEKYWPADIHLLGKDNAWFHAVYWPAFLKSAGLPLPKCVFVHGFLTFNGQKISKSLGNAISPIALTEKYGADAIRYFIARNFVLGEDGDFSESALVERHNNELANKLGNLVSRLSALAEQHGLEKAKQPETLDAKNLVKHVNSHFDTLSLDKALNDIFSFIDTINAFLQDKKPWETHDARVLYQASNALKDATILLSPFIPETCGKIAQVFDFEITLKALKSSLPISKVKKAQILFKKIDMAFPPFSGQQREVSQHLRESSQQEKTKVVAKQERASHTTISYEDFAKLDMRIGRILDVKEHPEADKLYVFSVDVGESKPRTIVAGLRLSYRKEELKGKCGVFVVNLAPRNLKGIESNGMILAAGDSYENVALLVPEKEIREGSKVK